MIELLKIIKQKVNVMKKIIMMLLMTLIVTGPLFAMDDDVYDYDAISLLDEDIIENSAQREQENVQRLERLFALYDNHQQIDTDDLERDLELLQNDIFVLKRQEASLNSIFSQGLKPQGYFFGRLLSLSGAALGVVGFMSGLYLVIAQKIKIADSKKKAIMGLFEVGCLCVSGLSLKIYSTLSDKTEDFYDSLEDKLAIIKEKIARDTVIIDMLVSGLDGSES